jgi:ssDNA-binding replication factor A large subunit
MRDGNEKDKRAITIIDDSQASVEITFWGNCAHAEGLQIGRIVAIKDCRVSDYNGVSLNGPYDAKNIKVDEQI